MNQPKPMQVRLPFKVPKPKKGKEPAVRICGLCRQKDSKYSCPRCNVAYCSLDCFRSQEHAQCSELFYRETIQSSIASDPSHSMEEKKHMMDILQRIKDGEEDDHAVLEMLSRQAGAGGDGELGGKLGEGSGRSWEVDEDEEELARQLEGVDIDSIDTNALFHLLPKAHRDRFIAALRNPESEDAKALVELAAKNGSDIPDVVHGAGGEAGPSKPSVTTPAQAKTMSKNNATVIGAGTDTNVIGTPTSPPPAFMVKAFSDEATALNHGPDEDVDEWDFGSDGGREPSEVKGWWECPTGSALPDGAQEDGNGPGMGDQEAATARQGKAGDRRREDTGETVVFDFDDGVTYGENVVIDGVGYAADPPLVDEAVLKAIKVPQGTGSQLRYNGIAICLAYLETASLLNIASFSPTALPSSSSRFVNALSLMHTFIPLLSTPRSTVRHLTFRSAYTSVWEAISPHLKLATQVQPSLSASGVKSDIPPHRVLLHLLEILPDLLHPPIDTTLQPRLFHVFGDLHAFYERYKKGGATRRKLAFYVVALSQMGRGEWLALEQEVQGELELLRGEFGVLDDGQGDQGVIAGGKDEGKIQGNYFP